MSVGKFSNDGNVSIFTHDKVQVYKETNVLITCKGKHIIILKWDERGRYCIPLMQTRGQWWPRTPTKQPKKLLQEANSVYDFPTTEEAIKWMHAVCGYPFKFTCIKAIKAGNFTGWPMLNKPNAAKYYPETTETPKGQFKHTRKNVRSNKPTAIPFEKQKQRYCEVRRWGTSTLGSMTSTTQFFRTKQDNFLPDPNEATSTSWLWWK